MKWLCWWMGCPGSIICTPEKMHDLYRKWIEKQPEPRIYEYNGFFGVRRIDGKKPTWQNQLEYELTRKT